MPHPREFHCSTPVKRFDKFTNKLLDEPLVPFLFIQKTIELSALSAIDAAPPEAVGVMAGLSGVVTPLWYYLGDDLEEAVDGAAENVAESK